MIDMVLLANINTTVIAFAALCFVLAINVNLAIASYCVPLERTAAMIGGASSIGIISVPSTPVLSAFGAGTLNIFCIGTDVTFLCLIAIVFCPLTFPLVASLRIIVAPICRTILGTGFARRRKSAGVTPIYIEVFGASRKFNLATTTTPISILGGRAIPETFLGSSAELASCIVAVARTFFAVKLTKWFGLLALGALFELGRVWGIMGLHGKLTFLMPRPRPLQRRWDNLFPPSIIAHSEGLG